MVQVGYHAYDIGCFIINAPCVSMPCKNGGKCTNEIDSKTAYNCTCQDDFFGDNCENAFPKIISMSPNHGPLAGGTLITIVANYGPEFQPDGVYIGDDIFLNLTDSMSNRLVIQSPPHSEPVTDLPVIVSFLWRDIISINRSANANFSYLPNPNISFIYPYQHLYTGGTILHVSGTDMDAALFPVMNITMIVSDVQMNVPVIKATYAVVCSQLSGDSMICRTPLLDVPSEVLPQLNVLDYIPASPFSNPTISLLAANGSYHCSPDGDTMKTQPNVVNTKYRMNFNIGFAFDGYGFYGNYDQLIMYAPPEFCLHATLLIWEVFVDTTKGLPIQGRYLLRGCTFEDYSVFVEGTQCQVVGLNNDTLWFQPQNVTAMLEPSKQWVCPAGYEYHLTVYIGYRRYEVGCIHYNFTSNNFCKDYVCKNNGTCVNMPSAAVCNCDGTGYYGANCQFPRPVTNDLSKLRTSSWWNSSHH
jgi:hypothetical protein